MKRRVQRSRLYLNAICVRYLLVVDDPNERE